jgi:hypothetical protein
MAVWGAERAAWPLPSGHRSVGDSTLRCTLFKGPGEALDAHPLPHSSTYWQLITKPHTIVQIPRRGIHLTCHKNFNTYC